MCRTDSLYAGKRILLKTEGDIEKIIEGFNGFHDGFIKSLRLINHDYFNKEKAHVCLGIFDVWIDFAHYNYDANPPFNQIIRAVFKDIKDFNLDFRGIRSCDCSINDVNIENTERIAENNLVETCFTIKIHFDFFDKEHNKWIIIEKNLFSFKEALFKVML